MIYNNTVNYISIIITTRSTQVNKCLLTMVEVYGSEMTRVAARYKVILTFIQNTDNAIARKPKATHPFHYNIASIPALYRVRIPFPTFY